jgi:hypothetical protein
MSISEAKQRLATFVIYKNSSLAKAEAAILHLLTRASADFLPGPTRIAYRDIEGIRALIEALPNTSRIQARTLERSYSAKRGRACTFQELIKGLEQFRDMIDRDIKENGASPNTNMKRVMNQNKYTSVPYRNNPVKKNISSNYSSFLAEKRTEQVVPQFKKNSSNYSQNPRMGKSNNSTSPKNPLNKNRPIKMQPTWNNNKSPYTPSAAYTKGRQTKTRNNYNQKERTTLGAPRCELCGIRGHRNLECRNMRDDTGKIIKIVPTYGKCSLCPNYIQPRLGHPEILCPYRQSGPLNKYQRR